MKTLKNIQCLRGVAVIAVLLFHLVTIEKKYGGSVTILPNILDVGLFGVDLFFVISGFVMVWARYSVEGRLDNLLMIPILFCAVLWVGFLSYSFVEMPLLKLTRIRRATKVA